MATSCISLGATFFVLKLNCWSRTIHVLEIPCVKVVIKKTILKIFLDADIRLFPPSNIFALGLPGDVQTERVSYRM